MIDGTEDDVIPAPTVGEGASFDGEVDGFGSAGRENDFFGRGSIDETRNAFAGFVEGGAGFDATGVDRAGAGEFLRKPGEHRFEDGRFGRSAAEMVEANALHCGTLAGHAINENFAI